jgi:hypothetical protein
MEYTVVLENRHGRYRARVPMLPDCVSEGRSREEALWNVRATIADQLRHVEITRVDVEAPAESDPWEPFIGMWADDPTWAEFQAEITAYRQGVDAETTDG